MRQYGRPVNQAAPKSADKPKEKDDIEESSKIDSEKKENNTRTKFQKLLVKLKLDKHHRMERFAISSISLILVCALLTVYAAKLYLDHKKIVLTEQAIYTTDTVWSLSGGNVHVENIYRNEATTKVFILCKMGEDTMDKMSTDASNYQMFVTGYTERLTNNLAGAIYMFGNTGYMGLYFTDAKGIDAHMYDIVVRNTNVLSADADEGVPSRYNDESFKYHDQIQIYANLAGSSATVASFLDAETPDLTQMYAQTVLASKEAELRTQLNDTLVDMNTTMGLINEYRDRLEKNGIQIPPMPAIIAHDYITTDVEKTKNNATQFDPSIVSEKNNIISDPYSVTIHTSEGTTYETYKEQTGSEAPKLYLVTDSVFPGGYQFNFQDLSLADHFVKTLPPEGTSVTQWVINKNAEKAANESVPASFNWGTAVGEDPRMDWYYTNGTPFIYSEAENYDSFKKQINDDKIRYEEAVCHLYELKYHYQVELLYNYVNLAQEAETTENTFSVNASEKALTMYWK